MTAPAMSTPKLPTAAPLLELRNVDAAYGPFRSLFDVSLAVRPGSVTALLGANGAGKTTVARVATGLVRPTAGEVWFAGERIAWGPPPPEKKFWLRVLQRTRVAGLLSPRFRKPPVPPRPFTTARAGVVHAPEGRSVFASLSVRENLELSFRRELGSGGVNDALAKAYELFPRLGERSKQIAGTLSGGEQRMLSLARVMVNPPKLLVADELSLGLAPIVVDEVYANLGAIRDAGTAILLVEQYVGHALAIADDVVVLNHGAVAHAGPATTLDDIAEHLL
jgi:ABC-type branched-chain amino acid transport systems, ATPase component